MGSREQLVCCPTAKRDASSECPPFTHSGLYTSLDSVATRATTARMAEEPELPQRTGRHSFEAEAGIRRSGRRPLRVRVFDGSTSGCKIEFADRPAVGELVWIRFDGLEAIEATVAWVDGYIGGLKFTRRLNDAVFAQLVLG